MSKNSLSLIVLTLVAALVLSLSPATVSAAFDQSRLLDDDAFINTSTMSSTSIQNFLTTKGSVLASFQEGGRSAATIVFDAAMANKMNPQVLLTTLQKEQSLITLKSYDTATDPEGRMRKAAGYACPDSGGCDSRYAGFTKQVDGMAFQFRYNFDGSTTGKFTDYQVGQTMTFDGTAVTLNNKATASLYRYTPHVSGGRSFYNFFFSYFLEYSSLFVSQNGYPVLAPGDSYKFNIKFQNIGNKSWDQQIVRLGTDGPKDRVSPFWLENSTGNGEPTQWNTDRRVAMTTGPISPGAVGDFSFYMTAPTQMKPGVYREYFRPIAEGIQWLDEEKTFWDVTVANHIAQWAGQNVGTKTVEPGESFMLEVKLRNSGLTTWRNFGDNPVRLGTSRSADRTPIFLREDAQTRNTSGWVTNDRVAMVETTVAPGEIGTFRFWYTVPAGLKLGTYREYFQPVHERIAWMNDLGIYFDLTVAQPKATFVSQSNYPTLAKGESALFSVSYLNSGTSKWTKSGASAMRLGALRPTDRQPTFSREDAVNRNSSGWVSPSRVTMVQDEVAPGQVGTFTFWYTVPADKPAGTHREFFGLTQEGYGLLPDNGLYWDITVR